MSLTKIVGLLVINHDYSVIVKLDRSLFSSVKQVVSWSNVGIVVPRYLQTLPNLLCVLFFNNLSQIICKNPTHHACIPERLNNKRMCAIIGPFSFQYILFISTNLFCIIGSPNPRRLHFQDSKSLDFQMVTNEHHC